MFPGTALGVMIGDLAYTWLAFRLAKRTGRSDVTAMPLGLDSPSTIGMAFAVLGPAFVAAKARMPVADAATLAWQVGMAAMVLIGVFKLGMTFVGDRIRRIVPQAGLLGSIGGVGIALLGTLQLGEVFSEPIAGMVAFGIILYALVARIRLPFRAPEVLASVAVGAAIYYTLGAAGLLVHPITDASGELSGRASRYRRSDSFRVCRSCARVHSARAAVRDPHRHRRHRRHRERARRGRRVQHARHPARRGAGDARRRRCSAA